MAQKSDLQRQETGGGPASVTPLCYGPVHVFRILHTSDWHLGHVLHRRDRGEEHDAFLSWLVDRVCELDVDALIVAGDVYQSANPPAQAETRFYDFLGTMAERAPRTKVVVIAGNHDSPQRLDAARALYRPLGVEVRGRLSLEDCLIHVEGQNGAATIAAIPFLRPSDLNSSTLRDLGHRKATEARLAEVLKLANRRRSQREPLIVVGHAHLLGGEPSDSERNLVSDDEEAVSAAALGDAFDYAAFGHLHLAQPVQGARAPVRYCGSPIPLSLAEASYPHQVLEVDFVGRDVNNIVARRVPRHRELIRFQVDDPKPLAETLKGLSALDVSGFGRAPYLEVGVFLTAPEPALHTRVVEALAGKNVDLLKVTAQRAHVAGGRGATERGAGPDLSSLNPERVFTKLHQAERGEAPSVGLMRAFRSVYREALDESGLSPIGEHQVNEATEGP